MAKVLSGGTKIHLMKYKGLKNVEGSPRLVISVEGKTNKACGGRYRGQLNMVEFSRVLKRSPEIVCKKCAVRYKELMQESAKIRKA